MSTRKIGSRGLLVDMTAKAMAERIHQADPTYDLEVLMTMPENALRFIYSDLEPKGPPLDLRDAEIEQNESFDGSKFYRER